MNTINKETVIKVSEEITKTFDKNRTAGYIVFRSLEYLDEETSLYVRCRVAGMDTRLPEDLCEALYAEIGDPFKTKRKSIEKNLPVKKLIEMFSDRKSGMVLAAVRQLKDRYLYLEYKDQIRVMDLFLDCSVSYRAWCYRTLSIWREPKYDETLIAHWRKYRDHNCLHAILKKLPSHKIKELYPDIRSCLNRSEYLVLLERFGKEEWVEIDKERVKDSSSHVYYYLNTMSKTRVQLPVFECAELFYEYLQEEFSDDEQEELYLLNSRSYVRKSISQICFHFEEIRLRLPHHSTVTIGDFLKIFAQMGYYDLLTGICIWAESLSDRLPRPLPTDDLETKRKTLRKICKDRFLGYIRRLQGNMPYKFDSVYGDTETVIADYEFRKLKSNPAASDLIDRLGLIPSH